MGHQSKDFLTSMVTGSISGLGFSGLMFDNKGFGPCAPGGGGGGGNKNVYFLVRMIT
jgi:hypothetical protein